MQDRKQNTLINNISNHVLVFFGKQAFGVCEWWAEKLNIPTHKLRLLFIYASFLTLGSPLIIYLPMAFIKELKKYLCNGRKSIWEV
jgi:phage shock protein PspC (stress-responsive transcriptional regulator)